MNVGMIQLLHSKFVSRLNLILRSPRFVGLVIERAQMKGPLIANGLTSNVVRFVLLAFLIVATKILSRS